MPSRVTRPTPGRKAQLSWTHWSHVNVVSIELIPQSSQADRNLGEAEWRTLAKPNVSEHSRAKNSLSFQRIKT